MTESTQASNELAALLEERRRYESWLDALEARRASTAPHVFERVQADYRTRLERVSAELAAHRQAVEEERASVQSRLALLEAEEKLRRDERAELDLRVHVGELAGSEAEAAFHSVDEIIEQLTGEKDGLAKRVTELDELLRDRVAPAARESSIAAAPGGPHVAPHAPPPTAPVQADSGNPAREAARHEPLAQEPGQPAPGETLHTPGGSFDELAFLTEVVGEKPTAGQAPSVVRDTSDADSLLSGLHSTSTGTREAPLAANVPANTPIVLRSSGEIEQRKTLKCTDCGAMNYPTEWYCERCGAELAAL